MSKLNKGYLLNDLSDVLLYIFIFSIPFKISISNSILFFLILIVALNFFLAKNKKGNREKSLFITVFSGYFLWNCITLLYSDYPFLGLKQVEKILPLLLFPLFFFPAYQPSNSRISRVLKSHVYSCLFVFFASEIYIALSILFSQRELSEILSYRYGYFSLAALFSNVPNYLSFFCSLGVFFSLFLYKNHGSIKWLIASVFIAFLVIQLQTKNSIIFLVLGFPIILYWLRFNFRIVLSYILVCVFFGLLIGYIISTAKGSQARHFEKRFFRSFSIENQEYNEDRIVRWKASFEYIGEHPLLGTGIGADAHYRELMFRKNGLVKSANKRFNDHNQYIETLFSVGLIGLILFILPIGIHLKYAFEIRFFPAILFILMFLFFCLTESVIDRNKGVLIFAVYNTLFFSYALKEKQYIKSKSFVLV